ncbi:MAG: CBS domain-containing protein, partial [Syntrophomonadaceae bacterium]|nr:CBS domain-containing protein [Syntrophomonadaceae bacterium]
MDIITSHNALDFDGLASMVAANILYPSATKVFCGTLSKNVKKFMALYKDLLIVKNYKDINLDEVKRMIIVDTASPNRLGKLKDLALNPNVEKHVYDHHPISEDDLIASIKEVEMLGAATTILVEKIIEKGLEISSFDATILALGIYEDTGSLQFPSTTARDARVVACLLDKGANLAVITEFMGSTFTAEQRELLQILLNNTNHYDIKNLKIIIATSNTNEFVLGLDVVTYRLFEMEDSDAIFVVSMMEGKVNVVGRSRNHAIKVNEILRKMGGGGHEKAASAIIRKKEVAEVSDDLIRIMEEDINVGLIAADIMSSPVKTVPASVSMEEAGRLMLRYGHTGMPVVDESKMIGVISRRDVDKAKIHNLGHAPVKGFMTSDVQAITPLT